MVYGLRIEGLSKIGQYAQAFACFSPVGLAGPNPFPGGAFFSGRTARKAARTARMQKIRTL